MAAEFCRSAIATRGLPRAAPLFQDLNLPVVRGLTRSLHILHSRSTVADPMPMADFKQNYTAQRIDDQIAYYQRQDGRALPQFTRLKVGFWITTILAISCTLNYALARTWDFGPAEWVVLKTERALLQEVLEWHSITSFSESH